jgi:hypothetical protein
MDRIPAVPALRSYYDAISSAYRMYGLIHSLSTCLGRPWARGLSLVLIEPHPRKCGAFVSWLKKITKTGGDTLAVSNGSEYITPTNAAGD